jgi:hypothetical protein
VLTLIGHKVVPAGRGCPWGLSVPIRLLLVLIHLRTDLTTRALTALFAPANRPQTGSSTTSSRSLPSHFGQTPTVQATVDHRRHSDPRARPADHRDQQELPAQHQHTDTHLRETAHREPSR